MGKSYLGMRTQLCTQTFLASTILAASALMAASGCSSRGSRNTDPVDNQSRDSRVDGGVITVDSGTDSRPWTNDGGSVNPCSSGCQAAENCGGDGQGNGLDDDCNGQIDDGCMPCDIGTRRECFGGPPDRRRIGACTDGVMVCGELGWEPCQGQITPSDEICDGTDNDCNDVTDDLAGCNSRVICPGSETALPLSNHTLRGSRMYQGSDVQAWNWEIECPDTVPGNLCPRLSSSTSENTDVYVASSGTYRVVSRVTLNDGTSHSCSWPLYVRGGGLRVELNWPEMGDRVDLDLHLQQWTPSGNDFGGADTCYYGNCKPGSESPVSWPDHDNSALSNCESAPRGVGRAWQELGYCRNPRLDVDTNGGTACDPSITDVNNARSCGSENVNVDEPVLGRPYRIMVNYFGKLGSSLTYEDSGPTAHPTVNIFCGGAVRAVLGESPLVQLNTGRSLVPIGGAVGGNNQSWYVADVVFSQDSCGAYDCRIYPIGTIDPGRTGGEIPFGPAWSCDYNASNGTCN